MFNILFTEDVLNDKFYFSKSIGDIIPLDPAGKFEAIELEDGTKSVITKIYRSFGTKQSMNAVWETIDPENAETNVNNDTPEAEEPVNKVEKPETLIIKEVTAKLESETPPADDIVMPDPITKTIKKTK